MRFPFCWDISKLSDLSGPEELLPDEETQPRAGNGQLCVRPRSGESSLRWVMDGSKGSAQACPVLGTSQLIPAGEASVSVPRLQK